MISAALGFAASTIPGPKAQAYVRLPCNREVILSPADGAIDVPTDLIVAMGTVNDPSCALENKMKRLVLVRDEELIDLVPIFPFTPAAFSPTRSLDTNQRYELQLRYDEVVTSSIAFVTGAGGFEPVVLKSASLEIVTEPISRDQGGSDRRNAHLTIDVASLGGNVGPIDVGLGGDESSAMQAVFPASMGDPPRRRFALLLRHARENNLTADLGSEEDWPLEHTCLFVRALARNSAGGCMHPQEGCLLEASHVSTCAETPVGCGTTGKPGLEALLMCFALFTFERCRRRSV